MFSTNEYTLGLAGLTVVLMLMCLSYVSIERVYECSFTGSMKYERETYFYYPWLGRRNCSYENCEELSHFHTAFYPQRILDRSWCVIEEDVTSGSLYFYMKKVDVLALGDGGVRDSGGPYFLHLYNKDENFRMFVHCQLDEFAFTQEWFLTVACARYRCGGPCVNLFSAEGRALFAYDPDFKY